MTFRLFVAAFALGATALAGCQGASGPAGDADLDDLAAEGADPFDQLAYDAGYQSAQQMLAQDSSFSFERFREGFLAGLNGDSTEIAYALGLRTGLGLRADTIANIDPNVFLTGVREGLQGAEARLNEDLLGTARMVVEDSLQIRQLRGQAATNPAAAERLRLVGRNAVQADSFLAAVRNRDGYRQTPTGVLYTVTQPGQGASPSLGDQVAVRYEGRLANGQVFDQSGEEPAVFPVGGVVPGFRDALLDMKVGESRTIVLSPKQAYGLTGSPGPGGQGGIPPNAALEFDVTLVEILEGQPQGLPPGFAPGQ